MYGRLHAPYHHPGILLEFWFVVKNRKEPRWPGLHFGPYERYDIAGAVNEYQWNSRSHVGTLCGFYAGVESTPVGLVMRTSSSWTEWTPTIAFEFGYNGLRGN